MHRVAIVARLKDGKSPKAEELLRGGPPFDPEVLGLDRHTAFVTAGEVVFLFEAPEVEWIVNELIDDQVIAAAFEPWREIIDGPPHLAREGYSWSREGQKTGVGLGL
jgi:hypothetical protein